jgi:hypothetical protein
MKKLLYRAWAITALLFYSCGFGSSDLPTGNVNFQMLSDEAELIKVYDLVVEKLGDNIKYVDKIRMSISRPSKEGSIIKEGRPDEFYLNITHLYQADKKKLYEMCYGSELGWYSVGAREVQLIGGGDVEKFRLEDEVFDMSPLTVEILYKIVQDALAKYKDEEKYSYQYVQDIVIDYGVVEVTIYGKLSANDLEKKNYYEADWDGKPLRN